MNRAIVFLATLAAVWGTTHAAQPTKILIKGTEAALFQLPQEDGATYESRRISLYSQPRSAPPQGVIIGKTAYNHQTNGMLHERIIWDPATKTIHTEWIFGDISEANVSWMNRRMYYNFYDGSSWLHGMGVPIETKRSGYGSLAVDANNAAIAVSHYGSGVSVYWDFMAGFGFFTEALVWDEASMTPKYNPTWPDIAVDKQGVWHVVATNYSDDSGVTEDILNNVKDNVIYWRSADRGQTWSAPIGIVPGPYAIPLTPFDDTLPKELDIEKQIQVSDVSNKLGIVIPSYAHDMVYFESTDGGKTWKDPVIVMGNLPLVSTDSVNFPPQYDILVKYDSLNTDLAVDTLIAAWEEEYNIQPRPLRSADFMYINDEPHIVWAEAKTPGGTSYYPGGRGVSWNVPYYRGLNGDSTHWEAGFRIKHWSPSTGVSLIEKVDEIQGVYTGGGYNILCGPQIGRDEDGNLYCVFVRASRSDTVTAEDNIDQQKTSWGPLSYCKLWGSKSKDNGKTWSEPVLLTPEKANFHRDLRFPAVANKNPRGKLHILYQDSPVPGSAIGGTTSDHGKFGTADMIYWECPTSLFSDTRKYFGPEIEIRVGMYAGILDFGDIGEAGIARRTITVRNDGDQDLKIQGAFAGDRSFKVSPSTFTVAPGESREVEIIFQPLKDGEFDTFIALPNNDPNEGNAGFPVRGKGIYVPMAVAEKPFTALSYSLEQNYPNPFNPATVIAFTLPERDRVRLAIYNMRGEVVAVPVDGELPAGRHEIKWQPEGAAAGIYFYRLTTGAFQQTRRMIYVR